MLATEVEAFCGKEKAIKVLDLASGTGKVGRAVSFFNTFILRHYIIISI